MKTQMENLRQLVVHDLGAYLSDEQATAEKAKTAQWISDLCRIEKSVFLAFRVEVFGKAHDRLVERHIRQAQSDCIYMMDVLAQYTAIPTALQAIHQLAITCLENILSYIEHNHSKYFNLHAPVPKAYFLIAVQEIKDQTPVLQAALKRRKTDPELQTLICSGLTTFASLQVCSYEQLMYAKHMIQSVLQLCREGDEESFTDVLIEHLLYLRFNSNGFTRYCKAKIAAELSMQFRVEEQFDRLWRYKRQFKAQQERSSGCFEPYNLSARLELLEYVKAEIQYLKRKMPKEIYAQQPVDFSQRLAEGYRIKWSVSADVLAYLIRLLIEVGVVTANPRTELMTFLARSCETAGIGVNYLSANSLNTKYKQVVQNTAIAVRSILVKMLKKLDADFKIN